MHTRRRRGVTEERQGIGGVAQTEGGKKRGQAAGIFCILNAYKSHGEGRAASIKVFQTSLYSAASRGSVLIFS